MYVNNLIKRIDENIEYFVGLRKKTKTIQKKSEKRKFIISYPDLY